MPDGGSPRSIVFRRATRGIVSPLILLTGGSGTGKSYSMMRLMRGYVGPEGRIFIIDTDNGRARLYADEFDFFHYDLQPPFRPRDFEAAIIEAQKQKADIIGVDNISHEHYATNEYHDEEVQRLSRGDPARAEAVKMLAWVKPKVEHKHLFLTAYRANVPIVFCAQAERKLSMVKQTEGKDRGKIVPVDLGYQPICGADLPYAMTMAFILDDVNNPGMPRPIKALLPALKPIIHLDRPLDEETGRRIGAWARGEEPASKVGAKSSAETGVQQREETPPPSQPPPESDKEEAPSPPPDDPEMPPPPDDDRPPPHPPDDLPPADEPPADDDVEARIKTGAQVLALRFAAVTTRSEHLAIVDEAETQKQIAFLRRRRKNIYDEVLGPALKLSWKRTDPPRNDQQPAKQGDLMP